MLQKNKNNYDKSTWVGNSKACTLRTALSVASFRVTRIFVYVCRYILGECLLLGSFLITKVDQISGLLFNTVHKCYILIWAKNGLGYILGDFFNKHI
jgi:hypothetical protein